MPAGAIEAFDLPGLLLVRLGQLGGPLLDAPFQIFAHLLEALRQLFTRGGLLLNAGLGLSEFRRLRFQLRCQFIAPLLQLSLGALETFDLPGLLLVRAGKLRGSLADAPFLVLLHLLEASRQLFTPGGHLPNAGLGLSELRRLRFQLGRQRVARRL